MYTHGIDVDEYAAFAPMDTDPFEALEKAMVYAAYCVSCDEVFPKKDLKDISSAILFLYKVRANYKKRHDDDLQMLEID